MIEQRPSGMRVIKEILRGVGVVLQMAFDPRTDPAFINFMEKHRDRFVRDSGKGKQENMSIKGGTK